MSELKQDARSARLTIRSLEEKENLKKKLQLEARKECLPTTKAFGDCAKQNGLMVVLKCRKENTAMTECMDKYYNDAEFEKFLIREGYNVPKKKTTSWM